MVSLILFHLKHYTKFIILIKGMPITIKGIVPVALFYLNNTTNIQKKTS